ncbi:RusA family crossover junction endodeoxyribonuclease [Vagococcus xieshaowenii]|uniref:RusA family crossover junction endodeoxyribonuclease n=1 Tax=Vagococcus xieshaowenii TaxID=2562451 RepID=A0AAJ5JQL4_9ENTE|nr:RusA family crossover junction endodeoxyribonuclease [Vagococcus xieshaowenii]QCA28240.1 RusA family crossover junction endodeoxyribonuclease [Vagococcus xieshaowenii]TFZ41895.1 RusA family crossover junction endodeoxyribonuclease [Vagococcus xieshaowenii]
MVSFFISLKKVPTTTHQQKQVNVAMTKKTGKPVFYEPEDLKKARALLMAHLGQHVPAKRINGPLRMTVKWLFPVTGKHKNGEYKYTKPDLDNSNKLLQDCMTELGFWKDDSYVVSLIAEKFWAELPGIFIELEEIE